MNGNPVFPKPPVEMAAFRTAIDTFSALVTEAEDGGLTSAKKATIDYLMPATTYAFQVRALGKLGHTDWSDSVSFICA